VHIVDRETEDADAEEEEEALRSATLISYIDIG